MITSGSSWIIIALQPEGPSLGPSLSSSQGCALGVGPNVLHGGPNPEYTDPDARIDTAKIRMIVKLFVFISFSPPQP